MTVDLIASVLLWLVGVATGAYLTHASHPLWCGAALRALKKAKTGVDHDA